MRLILLLLVLAAEAPWPTDPALWPDPPFADRPYLDAQWDTRGHLVVNWAGVSKLAEVRIGKRLIACGPPYTRFFPRAGKLGRVMGQTLTLVDGGQVVASAVIPYPPAAYLPDVRTP